MWLKVLITFVCASLLGSAFFFLEAGRNAQSISAQEVSQRKPAAIFESEEATLTLYRTKVGRNQNSWPARLALHTENCKGGLGLLSDAEAPIASLVAGSLDNGIVRISQPATVGEASCNIEINTKDGAIIESKEISGMCEAWHGKSCDFSTDTLGAMSRTQQS